MKKYLFTVLLALVGSLTAMAGLDIKVIEGDKKFMKSASGDVVLVFDWEGATYDNKMPLESQFTDLERLKPHAWYGFVEVFNEKAKNMKIVKDEAAAKYKFAMKVTNMDRYIKVMGFVPGPATKVWGTLTVTDLSNGEVIAVIQVTEVDGGANPSPDGSFSDCFEELAKQMTKLK